MKIAQSSAVFFNHSLQYAIRSLHELGYDGIEIWGGRPHMYRQDLAGQMDEIVELLNTLDMKVCNFIPAQFRYPSILCSSNETVRKSSVEYIKSAIDNAVRVGSPSISLCPGMTLFDDDLSIGWKQLVKSFKEIEKYSEDKGLTLLIEPAHKFESNLILTVDDCLRMLDQLDSQSFGILLDIGHAFVNGENFDEIIRKCEGLPLHIHLDDNNGDFDSHMIPGTGKIDFDAVFKALEVIKYSGYISVELGAAYCMDPLAACRESMEFLRSQKV